MPNETVNLEIEVSNITGDQIDQYVRQGVEKMPTFWLLFCWNWVLTTFVYERGF